MKYIIKNGAVSLDGNTILEEINIEINDREHIGIVGKNGVGKSTLLHSIIDNSLLEEGIGNDTFQVIKQESPSIGYLKQIELNDNNTLLEEIRSPFSKLIKMEDRLNYLLEENLKKEDSKLVIEYVELESTFKLLGGYSYKKEYEVLLNKFGFSTKDKEKLLKDFSGGERTKIAFIKMLLSKPDILLLDEPTNHLDIDTVIWLEEYLKNYKKAIVIVSHDRMFLNNIVSTIYDISYGSLTKYSGNYDFYLKQKKLNYEKSLKDYEFQQKEINRLRSVYERFRSKPTKAKLALSRLHQLEKMNILDRPKSIEEMTFKVNMKDIVTSSKEIFLLKNLVVGYDKPLFTLDFMVRRGDKLGIIGPNGIGKSTILKTLGGLISSLDGDIILGKNLNIGYFDQNLAMLSEEHTILEEFMMSFPSISEYNARCILGSFLFKEDDVFKKINVLSGGERVRLQLCKIFYRKPNVLLLDEPTNHLDIVSKQYLEDILMYYTGTIVFVSHDRYFINKIATSLLVLKDNKSYYYSYGYSDYINNNISINIDDNSIKRDKVSKKNTYNVNKEIKILERDITKLEKRIKELKDSLYLEEVYTDSMKCNEVNIEISELSKELDILNNKWLELSMEE